MGNCQAVDAATLVIQHPSGKVDKFYWPMSASEIMRMNPGHYVALLISTTLYHSSNNDKCPDNSANNVNPVRLTRIKLLRPTDTLVLGQVYRLITTQGIYTYFWLFFCSLFLLRIGKKGLVFVFRILSDFELCASWFLVFRSYERVVRKETCKDEEKPARISREAI